MSKSTITGMTNVRLFSVRFFQIYLWQSIEKKRKFLYVQLVQVMYTNFTIYAHSTDFDRGMVHIAQEQLSRCHIAVSYTHLDVYKRQALLCLLDWSNDD